MFTGLIETTGTVLSLKTLPSGIARLTIAAPALAGRWKLGDSIAVNGVCLTAIDLGDDHHPGRFAADLAQETIERTTLTSLTAAAVHGSEIEIAIIPHTYHATNLHTLLEGSPVNIETDVLSKYALRH